MTQHGCAWGHMKHLSGLGQVVSGTGCLEWLSAQNPLSWAGCSAGGVGWGRPCSLMSLWGWNLCGWAGDHPLPGGVVSGHARQGQSPTSPGFGRRQWQQSWEQGSGPCPGEEAGVRAELPCSLLCWRCVWGQALTGEDSSSGYSVAGRGAAPGSLYLHEATFLRHVSTFTSLPSKRH